MTAALFVFMLIQPLIGALSDKIGRRTSMLCFGSLATIFTVPILSALQNVSSPLCRFWSGDVRPADSEFYTSISGILKAEMFPAQVRALGVGLSCGRQCYIWWVGGVRSVVAEINRNGNSLLLVCDLDGRGGVSGFSLTLHRKGKGMRL